MSESAAIHDHSPDRRWAWIAALVLITLAAHWPVVTHHFVEWDDPHNISANPDLNPPTWNGLARYWVASYEGLYIPVTYTAWAAIALVARSGEGLNPHLFHAANLLVHIASSVTVFLILRCVLGGSRHALLGALVFSVHPVQVETIAWASGLKDLLCGAFSLAAIWLYILTVLQRFRSRMVGWLLATLCFALALLSKPTAVCVPPILIVLHLILFRRPFREIVPLMLVWLPMTVVIMIITRIAQPAPEAAASSPILLRPLIAADAVAFYLRQLVWPMNLALDYGRSPARVIASGVLRHTWIVPVAAAGAAWLLARRHRGVLAGAVIFLLALGPVLGFVPFSFQFYSTVADHYLYLPMFGIALAVAGVAAGPRSQWISIAAAAIILLLAARSWFQARVWHDTQSLLQHALRVNPQSALAHTNLSADALLRGDAIAAEMHARRALELAPQDQRIHTNLGMAMGMQGRFDEAIIEFEQALRSQPDDPAALTGLGDAWYMQNDPVRARHFYELALQQRPGYPRAARGLQRLDASEK